MTEGGTLLALLRAKEPARLVFCEQGREVTLSRDDVRERASRAARRLLPYRGRHALLLVARGEEFVTAFWGALAAGLVPAPVALPAGTAARAGDVDRITAVWSALGEPIVIVDARFIDAARTLGESRGLSAVFLTPGELDGEALDEWHVPAPDDVAFLQFSSGSTGDPKGVELTHANVLSNLRQLSAASGLCADDVVVSWMPYTHDMGLVGTHLAPLLAGATQVKLDPLEFVASPSLWFEAADRHRATILCTANFALGLSVKKVADPSAFDLSRVRIIANGGEPISPRSCRAFLAHFAPAGLRADAMLPMYGLAEATLAVSIPEPGSGLTWISVARGPFEREGRAVVERFVDTSTHLQLVDVGPPLPGVELRIVDVDDGAREVEAQIVGRIQIRGPNVTRGYFAGERVADWLDTGDLGFLVDGRLCVTGRAKDVIIANGRKLLAHDIEAVAEAVPGVRAGKACACGFFDPVRGEERAILFLCAEDPNVAEEVDRKIRAVLGIELERVVAVAPEAFAKTTSGKLQRFKLRDAFLAGRLGDVSSQSQSRSRSEERDLAIVAVACRFPGASTPEEFYAALLSGYDAVREVPSERWRAETYYPTRTPSKWGAFLDDVGAFDARFFGIDAAEAESLDPQHRLILELSYEALERASAGRGGNVGVFVGAGSSEYGDRIVDRALGGDDVHATSAVGNLRNLIAARVAHALDLKGPALVVDTACSSSLVALHLAREALCRRECDAALVGGVSLNLTAAPYILLGRAGALSPRGRCHAFSEDADGFVPGEGAGVVMVKRLDDARAEGDPILAIVRGTAINNDGRSISPMAPNPDGQERVIRAAWRDASLDPACATYVEAHGTGTPIGDPIEARSIARVMRGPLWIGSAKTNIGHLLAASGMASLIKVACGLERKRMPPSLHCARPRADLGALRVAREAIDISGPVGINAFGFGGTNAHVVLDAGDEPPLISGGPARAFELVALSALDEGALRRRIAATVGVDAKVAEIAADAAAREPLPHRAAYVVGSTEELRAAARTVGILGVASRRVPRLAFVFAGQGAQYEGQGRVLYGALPSFRAHFDRAAELVRGCDGPDLLEALLQGGDAHLRETRVAQPLLVAFEIALAKTLGALGVKPSVVVGHSVGELAAAVIAGILEEEAALRIATVRGRLMDGLTERGSMAAVFAPVEAVEARLAGHADARIAAINARHQIVIAGGDEALASIERGLLHDGFTTTRLNVSHAFHSPLMRPIREQLRAAMRDVPHRRPTTTMISTVTGAPIEALDAEYFVDHAERTVLFAQAIERVDADVFLEIGPGATLAGALRLSVDDRSVMSVLRRGDDDLRSLLTALATLWVRGVPVQLKAVAPKRTRAVLPTYPFERARHWLPETRAGAAAGALLGRRTAMTIDRAEYQTTISPELPLVAQHVVLGVHLLPAAACFELALEAVCDALGRDPRGLARATFRRPLDVAREPRTIDVVIERRAEAVRWEIRDSDGVLGDGVVLDAARVEERIDVAAIRARCPDTFDPRDLYARLREHGMEHGPIFQRIEALSLGADEVLASLSRGEGAARGGGGCLFDPALGDAAVQGIAALLMHHRLARDVLYVPFSADELVLHRRVVGDCLAHLTLRDSLRGQDDEVLRCDVTIADVDGRVQARIAGLTLKRARVIAVDRRVEGYLRRVDLEPVARTERPLPRRVAIVGGDAVARRLEQLLCERGVELDAESDFVIDLRGLAPSAIPYDLLGARPGLIVSGDTRTDPARASFYAFACALGEERRDVRAIEVRDGDVAAAVVAELGSEGPSSVVIRGDVRHRAVLRPALVARRSVYRRGGTYVVTGGGSGIGLAIARDLRTRFDARVFIFGRRSAPPDVDATYCRVDVADEAAVRAALSGIGAVDGIFHCAGILRPGLARDKSRDDLDATFAGKVGGARALVSHASHGSRQPGFVAFFSSVSAALPRFAGGLSDYAAANAALDALARKHGAQVVSIAWGAWGETGMGATDERRALASRVGLRPLRTEDGVRACELAIGAGLSHIVVADEAAPVRERAESVAAATPEGDVVDAIRALVARATRLRPEDIGLDDSLLSLGLESLAAVEIVKALEDRLGRRLPTTLLFEHPTLRRAAAALEAKDTPTLQRTERAEVSATQRAILLGEDLNPTLPPFAFLRLTLASRLDRDAVAAAAEAVVARHASLRTVFRQGRPSRATATVTVEDVADEESFVGRPFDRARAPLLRIGVRDNALLLCAHHAVADAWSLAIVARDLLTVLAGGVLTAIPTTPEQLSIAARPDDIEYFRGQLRDLPAAPRLLGDGAPIGPIQTVETRIDSAATSRLRARAAQLNVSLFHLVVALHAKFLARETGEPDVLLLIAHARRDARVAFATEMVGAFADTLPIRVRDDVLERLAPAARDAVTAALAHGSISSLDTAPLIGRRLAPSLSFASFPLGHDHQVVDIAGSTGGPTTALGVAAWEHAGELRFSWSSAGSVLSREALLALAHRHRAAFEGGFAADAAAWVPVHERILARALDTPLAPAVIDGTRVVTYRELERASRAVARAVRVTGTRVVGVRLPSGADAVIAIVGVLRAGAAYLPLDPTFPPVRLAAMAKEADWVIDDLASLIRDARDDGAPLEPITVDPEAPAYIMFTSGSTGTPKRVAVSHRSLAAFLDATQRCFAFTPSDRCAQTASLCFDASVRQVFAPLTVGATLLPVSRALLHEPDELASWLAAERVTVWGSVPSLFGRVLSALERRAQRLALRWVILGGEPLRAGLVRRLFDVHSSARVANVYGPTETTVNVTCHVVDARPSEDAVDIPIGRSIGTADVTLDVTPAGGDRGEIVVRGEAVAIGFGGEYRTGDIATAAPDGTLTFVGRGDRQIKLRGYRIELGEIESAIVSIAGVVRAFVSMEHERLRASVEGDVDAAHVRAALEAALPQYMVPHEIVVGALPSTDTGKLSRVEPDQPRERAFAEAFANVLGVANVGPDDDFFALGGDSLLAIEVFTQIRASLGAAPRAVEIFRHRTPRALARVPFAEHARPTDGSLTPVQVGFWIAHRMDPLRSSTWCATATLDGDLDIGRLRDALAIVTRRHPMVRASFHEDGLSARQIINDVPVPLDVVEASDASDVIARERSRAFDLSVAPLVRLTLVQTAPRRHTLVATAHHIVGDAWSSRIFARDLFLAYEGKALRPLDAMYGEPPSRPESIAHFRAMFATPYRAPRLRRRVESGTAVARAAVRGDADAAVLLSAWWRRLRELTGQSDLVIAVATSGRDAATADVFGPFARALPVRLTSDRVAEPLRATLSHADVSLRDVGALAPRVDGGTVSAVAQLFFTFVDADAMPMVSAETLRIEVDRAESPIIEGATDVLLAAIKHRGQVELRIEAPRSVASERELSEHVQKLASELTTARAALISYLPSLEHIRALTGVELPREDIRTLVFGGRRARLAERLRTRLGNASTILIARFADELTLPGLVNDIEAAGELAALHGARVVSLAGMLPSHTAYGASAASRLPTVRLTTGHATTVVAVVRTLERALARMRVDLPGARVGFLGVGSIGRAALELMLGVLPHPRSIGLLDIEPAHERLRALAESLSYQGEIRVAGPAEAPAYDVIIAATSVANVLDVNALRRGTILVDDSFPPCVDLDAAYARTLRGEILAVSGGTLDCGGVEREFVDVPRELEETLHDLAAQPSIAGCQLESLLLARDASLPSTIGLVDAGAARTIWAAAAELGLSAGRLRLGRRIVD